MTHRLQNTGTARNCREQARYRQKTRTANVHTHSEYATDPYTRLGECDTLEFGDDLISLRSVVEPVDVTVIALVGFVGTPPPRELAPFLNRKRLPLGRYRLIVAGQTATVTRAAGIKGRSVLLTADCEIVWSDTPEDHLEN